MCGADRVSSIDSRLRPGHENPVKWLPSSALPSSVKTLDAGNEAANTLSWESVPGPDVDKILSAATTRTRTGSGSTVGLMLVAWAVQSPYLYHHALSQSIAIAYEDRSEDRSEERVPFRPEEPNGVERESADHTNIVRVVLVSSTGVQVVVQFYPVLIYQTHGTRHPRNRYSNMILA